MDVNWNDVYAPVIEGEPRKMKFAILPKLFPWVGDFQANVDLTLEWLIREGKADEVRLSQEPVINAVRDGWYTVEAEPGQYLHCCYPQDLLKFRGQYETLRGQIMGSNVENLSMINQTAESARKLLWSAWNCIGGDGKRIEPDYEPLVDEDGHKTFQLIVSSNEWPRKWNYTCRICCEPLPKSLQLIQKMQFGKLAELQ